MLGTILLVLAAQAPTAEAPEFCTDRPGLEPAPA